MLPPLTNPHKMPMTVNLRGGKMPSVMTDSEWLDWKAVVKCKWIDCYAGMGLAGNGRCFVKGNFKDPDCPVYKNEDKWIKEKEDETV